MNKSYTKFVKIVSIIIMMLILSYSTPLVYAAETLEFDKTSDIVESEEDKTNKEVVEDKKNNEKIEKTECTKEDNNESKENKSNKEVIESKESETKDNINNNTENKTINSNSQEESKNTETKVEEEPSKKVLETKVGKTTVKIEYNPGVFPEGVALKAEKIEDEKRTQTIEKAIKEESAQSVSEMEALDISVLLNNEEVQPDVSKGNVKVIISGNGIDKDVKVYHFENDENSKVKKETSKLAEDSLEFEVEHFSVVAWAKLSGYTSDDKDIYVTWDSDTTTIALTWDKPEDGTESANIKALKSFISQYKNSVTTIDFSLRDENGNQVSIIMPKNSSYFFFYCHKLTNIIGEEYWDTSNVTSMQSMFDGCSNLTELDLRSFNTSNVTSMQSMFSRCNLNKIILGKDVTKNILSTLSTNWYKIPEGTLYTNLSNVYDGSTMSGIYVKELATAGTYAVWDEGNKTISIKNINDFTEITENDYTQIEKIKSFISKYKSQVETIDFTCDEKIALATNDGTGLFKDCTNLKEIKSIDNLDVSNVQDMSSMFENCTSLTNIDISGWDSDGTTNITNMNSMFKNCSTLTNVTLLSNADSTKDLADTAAMFEGCSKLTNIDLKNITTWAVEDMNSMFKNCSSLTNLDLTMNDTGCVKNMSSMFENCTNLENLKLVEFSYDYYAYISLFSTGNVTNMQNMFKNCSSLKNLELREFYTDKLQENGMEGMLSGLSSLDRIVLGEGIEKLDSNCGLEGDTWFKVNSGEVYTASELTEVYNPSMADVYLNGILEKHYYVSSHQSVDNLYEVHSPDKPFTGYCINLHRVGFGTYLDRIDTNDNSTLESLLDTPEEGGVHGYAPLGNNMKEALITLMYYGYPNDGAGIMEKYNLTESQYADITQEAIWDFTDRYGNPSGPTKYTGDELLAYNELVSQKYSNIENSDSLLFYVYKSWDETQQNMISIMSVANDIYGGVEVTKVDKNGNPLAGAEFTITNEYTGETRTIVSNANGIASICRTDEEEGLPAGIYAVEETKAPKGYNLTSDYYEFEISEANKIVTIGYKNGVPDENFMKFIDDEDESVVGGGLTITKKTNNGSILANVEFGVYTDSQCTNKISTLKTDANGVAQSGRKDFEPGKYYVKETKAPYGYKLNETVFEVTITENQFAELEVSNEAKKGKASIVVKKDLNGANIADYTFTFELIDDSGNVIQTKTNDKDGVVKFDEIEYTTADGTYRNYTVKEVIGDVAGITYDEHKELVTVTIADDGDDNLTCTPVYDGDGAVFINTYEVKKDEEKDDDEKNDEEKDDNDKNIENNTKNNQDEENSEKESQNKIEENSVKTGDEIIKFVIILIIALSTVTIIRIKKVSKK